MGKTKRKEEEENEGMKADRQAGTRARAEARLFCNPFKPHTLRNGGAERERKGTQGKG